MDYLHQELILGEDDVMEVTLDHPANVMLLDPDSNEATRVGRRREEGKLVRYAKKSGAALA